MGTIQLYISHLTSSVASTKFCEVAPVAWSCRWSCPSQLLRLTDPRKAWLTIQATCRRLSQGPRGYRQFYGGGRTKEGRKKMFILKSDPDLVKIVPSPNIEPWSQTWNWNSPDKLWPLSQELSSFLIVPTPTCSTLIFLLESNSWMSVHELTMPSIGSPSLQLRAHFFRPKLDQMHPSARAAKARMRKLRKIPEIDFFRPQCFRFRRNNDPKLVCLSFQSLIYFVSAIDIESYSNYLFQSPWFGLTNSCILVVAQVV